MTKPPRCPSASTNVLSQSQSRKRLRPCDVAGDVWTDELERHRSSSSPVPSPRLEESQRPLPRVGTDAPLDVYLLTLTLFRE